MKHVHPRPEAQYSVSSPWIMCWKWDLRLFTNSPGNLSESCRGQSSASLSLEIRVIIFMTNHSSIAKQCTPGFHTDLHRTCFLALTSTDICHTWWDINILLIESTGFWRSHAGIKQYKHQGFLPGILTNLENLARFIRRKHLHSLLLHTWHPYINRCGEIYPSSIKKRRKALVPLAWACTVEAETPRLFTSER
jgi:hypothetical protein